MTAFRSMTSIRLATERFCSFASASRLSQRSWGMRTRWGFIQEPHSSQMRPAVRESDLRGRLRSSPQDLHSRVMVSPSRLMNVQFLRLFTVGLFRPCCGNDSTLLAQCKLGKESSFQATPSMEARNEI